MERSSEINRKTKETDIKVKLSLDGTGKYEIFTGIPFFDHMLIQLCIHGFFDLVLNAKGDLEVDYHHTVEDVGLVLGDAFDKALRDRKGIKRYGHTVLPMDDALTSVAVDLSKRPLLIYNVPTIKIGRALFDLDLAKEFFRAFSVKGGMNLHINVFYGENEHHIIESIFKALGKSLDIARSFDMRIQNIPSSKGIL